ncbi:hypothetical protein NA2_06183 [Nitratireductor pacificus pht-3B]|uniref:Uncharacterized protein n=1 Tax=Nitratireductor pacificus pht-3B TaxID=391937 RepID=K2MRA3_9HYPH|nr:hypothetical protein NA2_06183 [Nitratireductor pacificus pht-3B]
MAVMLATGSPRASSILSIAQSSPEHGGSMIALESEAADRPASNEAAPLSYPTPSLAAAPHADPFRLTRSMIAAGAGLPDAPIATDDVTGAVAAKHRRGFVLPPVLIRPGVKSEPVLHAITPPRRAAQAQEPVEPETDEDDVEKEEPTRPATKPGAPL